MISSTRHVNGINLHVTEAGPSDGPLLILLHGFPGFSYDWREHIEPLASRGFHVVAPDMRGYNKATSRAASRLTISTRWLRT